MGVEQGERRGLGQGGVPTEVGRWTAGRQQLLRPTGAVQGAQTIHRQKSRAAQGQRAC